MSKHLKGPYRVRFYRGHDPHTTGHFQIFHEGGAHIGSTWILDRTPRTIAEANAHLFAASCLMYDYVRERADGGDYEAKEIIKTIDTGVVG